MIRVSVLPVSLVKQYADSQKRVWETYTLFILLIYKCVGIIIIIIIV